MINSVNLNGINYAPIQKKMESEPISARKNPNFGSYYAEENQSPLSRLKHSIVRLTDDVVGLVGFNAALWWLQNVVSGKILVGKINKHFTKDLPNNKLINLAEDMLEKEKGLNNLDVEITGKSGEAYYSHVADGELPANRVRVGHDSVSSLFHEIGHAKIENKSFLMKNLQRFRGHYTPLSLALYALLSGNKKDGQRHDWVIPLLAFSPELITEGMASHHGLKFLKEKVKLKQLERPVFNKIRNSYLTCFGTYLFVPVSIILLDAIRNGAQKERHRRKMARREARMGY